MRFFRGLRGRVLISQVIFIVLMLAMQLARARAESPASCADPAIQPFYAQVKAQKASFDRLVQISRASAASTKAEFEKLDDTRRMYVGIKWGAASLLAGIASGGLLGAAFGTTAAVGGGSAGATATATTGVLSEAARTSVQISIRQVINSTLGTFGTLGMASPNSIGGSGEDPSKENGPGWKVDTYVVDGRYAEAKRLYDETNDLYRRAVLAVRETASSLLDAHEKKYQGSIFSLSAGGIWRDLKYRWNPWEANEGIPAIYYAEFETETALFQAQRDMADRTLNRLEVRCEEAQEKRQLAATGRHPAVSESQAKGPESSGAFQGAGGNTAAAKAR